MKKFFFKYWNIFVGILFVFSVYHLVRDIFQIEHVENIISVSLHTSRTWCNPICDYVTFPPEIYIMLVSPILLMRKKFGILGISTIIVFMIWALAFWYSVFTKQQ